MKKAIIMLSALTLALCVFSSCGKGGEKEEKTEVVTNEYGFTDVYNDKGNIEKKVYYNDDGSENHEMRYEHDENGNIVVERKYLPDGTIDFKITYEYKKYGNMFKINKRVIYKSEEEISYYESDYKYEKYTVNGVDEYCLASYVTYNADDTVKNKTVYTYDDQANLKVISLYDSKGELISENKQDEVTTASTQEKATTAKQ